jgi:hypothetical protein
MLVQLALFGDAATEWLHKIMAIATRLILNTCSPPDLVACRQRVAREKHFRLHHRSLPQARLIRTADRALDGFASPSARPATSG